MDHPPPPSWSLLPQPLGAGAQGVVHRAIGARGEDLAVKLAHAAASSCELVRREAVVLRLLHQCGVPGLIEVLDAVHIDGRPAIVMPRHPEDLAAWSRRALEPPSPRSLPDLLSQFEGIARTLAALHRAAPEAFRGFHLVHRDVKPANVLIGADGSHRLCDLGSAIAVAGLHAVELSPSTTSEWAPLDQYLPGKVLPSPSWDTYALCGMLFDALAGARPERQVDPRPLLTDRGAEIAAAWRAWRTAEPASRDAARAALERARRGTVADDLLRHDVDALTSGDRQRLIGGTERLLAATGATSTRRARTHRALWALLVRGLSPLPSPAPNRFPDASELADLLRDVAAQPEAPSGSWEAPATIGAASTDDLAPDEVPNLRRPWAPVAMAAAALVAGAASWVGFAR